MGCIVAKPLEQKSPRNEASPSRVILTVVTSSASPTEGTEDHHRTETPRLGQALLSHLATAAPGVSTLSTRGVANSIVVSSPIQQLTQSMMCTNALPNIRMFPDESEDAQLPLNQLAGRETILLSPHEMDDYFGTVEEKPALALFDETATTCSACHASNVEYVCLECPFVLCEDCFFSGNTADHDELHEMENVDRAQRHCGNSRTGHRDSNFPTSETSSFVNASTTQLGMSNFLFEPCEGCERMIVDEETVFKCSSCVVAAFVVCGECYNSGNYEHDAQHQLLEFRWQVAPDIKERPVFTKGRDDDGNKVINDYTVVRELGRGSFAKVKLIQNVETKELFAVKVLKKTSKRPNALSPMCSAHQRAQSPSTSVPDALMKEIVVMCVLQHPNVVKLVEIIDDMESGKLYVIMEFCGKGPLHTLGQPPLDAETLRLSGQHVLSGLQYLHGLGFHHRDIKPANCLVNHNGVVKLADFGTCGMKQVSNDTEGTPAFMCPELLRGEVVDGAVADSWAFAMTLFQAAYGHLPFKARKLIELREVITSSNEIIFPPDTAVDEQLVQLLRGMLRKERSQRLQIHDAIHHPYFSSPRTVVLTERTPDISFVPMPESVGENHLTTSHELGAPDSETCCVRAAGGTDDVESPPQSREELYARAMSKVKLGHNVHQSFYGLDRVKISRKNTLAVAQRSTNTKPGDYDDDDLWSLADLSTPPALPQWGTPHMQSQHAPADSDPLTPVSPQATATTDCSAHGSRNSTTRRDAQVQLAINLAAASATPHHLQLSRIPMGNAAPARLIHPLSDTTKALSMSKCKLSSLSNLMLQAFTHLRDVSLSKNNFRSFPLEVLQCPRLQLLDLSFNRIREIPEQLAAAPFLERLSLHYNQVSSVPLKTLCGKHFQHLRLSDNPITRLCLDDGVTPVANVKVVLDDAPAVVQQWFDIIAGNRSGGLSVVWNDVYPKQIIPGHPWYVAASPLALYSVHHMRQLNIRHLVVPQFVQTLKKTCRTSSTAQPNCDETSSVMSSSMSVSSNPTTTSPRAKRRRSKSTVNRKIPILHPSAAAIFDGVYFVDNAGNVVDTTPSTRLSKFLQNLQHQQEEGAGSSPSLRGNVLFSLGDSSALSAEATDAHHSRGIVMAQVIDLVTRESSLPVDEVHHALEAALTGMYN